LTGLSEGFTDAQVIDTINNAINKRQVRKMAALLLLTMPDTWEAASQITLSAFLGRCIYSRLAAHETEDMVYNAIVFRWRYMA